ncbi:cytochrome P450 4A11-like isoform X2 [Vombatus ursinus]|uniref:Cytochrome P450 family 4 subfamily B member 1 n=1 Tax=Vombatus ursinus TaxID=29139 RepID=A0A4X2LG04_VOMUR|nr:cytochrome P450 4A11-like isoform X2 [Vombatus ursinus]
MEPRKPEGDVSGLLQVSFLLGLGLLVLKVAQLYVRRQRLLRDCQSFPGPPAHWLYGNVLEFPVEEELRKMVSLAEKFPCAFPRWFSGFWNLFQVYDPEYIKMILSKRDPKSHDVYKFLVPWIGKGLLVLNGSVWSWHRRLLTPAFHNDILKPYVGLMADSARVMLDKWEKLSYQPRSLEIFEHISLMTLDSLMKSAFSQQSNCQIDRRSNSYIQAVRELAYLLTSRMRNVFRHNDVLYWFSSSGRRARQAAQRAHQYTDQVIQMRRQQLKQEGGLEAISRKRHLDFLDILLCAKTESGETLSDEELRAEVDTFMFEGHDTTASGISWLLYALATHPEHQQKCREEIRGVLGDGTSITWDHLGQLPYTTMCIKEALRLYPPVPSIGRDIKETITFPDGRVLRAGNSVSLHIYALHHNPRVWPDPEVFDPLRFSPENLNLQHAYAFLPFSAGSRNCIGQKFAMNEMKVVLALTLLSFELKPDTTKPPVPISNLVLRSQNGIHLWLKRLH